MIKEDIEGHQYEFVYICRSFKGKGKGLDTCYCATYMSQTRDQQRFTISEVAAVGMSQWCRSALCGHLLPALTDNWIHGAASRHTIAPISHTRPSPRNRSYRRIVTFLIIAPYKYSYLLTYLITYSFPVPLRVGG